MKYAREKREILGWLALLTPIPLPFNQVLEWPVLFVYTLAVLYFLQQADTDTSRYLPTWALNVLGAVYFPIFLIDLRFAFLRQTPVKALLHLIMFLIIVKLYSMRRETEKWHTFVAIFFLFIGAMATSSHITIGLYLLAFMALSFIALGRLAHLHALAAFGKGRAASRESIPFRRPLAVGMLLIIGVSIPLFAMMPRIREPYILGRGGTGIGRTTGFSDSVNLSLTSSIRGNRAVAMRVQYDTPVASESELRFKGATFERYENRRWFRQWDQASVMKRRYRERTFDMPVDEPPESRAAATVFLEPMQSTALLVPMETLSVELPRSARELLIDPGGALILPVERRDTLRYELELATTNVIAARLGPPDSSLSALRLPEDFSPRMRQLATELMGTGTPEERVDRLETVLSTEYSYTDTFVERDGEEPLEDFLFVYRSGHCELFASAMVLMLRSEGIPARYVNGFLGAEYNPLEDYYIVRQQNAHAWVEAYTPERGWQVYDPTPPDGRPSIAARSLKLFFTQLFDYFAFRWDRYILTYGADDQNRFFEDLRDWATAWWKRLNGEDDLDGSSALGDEVALGAAEGEADGSGLVIQPQGRHLAIMVVIFIAAVAWIVLRRRPLTAGTVYVQMRELLAQQAEAVDDTTAPLEVQTLAIDRWGPSTLADAPTAIDRVLELYLKESFADEPLADGETRELKEHLKVIRRVAKEARKRRVVPMVPLTADS